MQLKRIGIGQQQFSSILFRYSSFLYYHKIYFFGKVIFLCSLRTIFKYYAALSGSEKCEDKTKIKITLL